MNRKNVVKGYGIEKAFVTAIYKGAGAADPTIPTDAEFSKQHNAAFSATRTGVGVYDCFLAPDSAPTRVFQCNPTVEGAALQAVVTTQYAAATRKVTVSVFTMAGAAAELTSGTAFLKLLIEGQDSSS